MSPLKIEEFLLSLGEARDEGDSKKFMFPSPHPNPLPQGEGSLAAF